jgi:hypothetical protein
VHPDAAFNIKSYEITNPETRLELFLSGVQCDYEMFYGLEEFELIELQGSIGLIFGTWENIFTIFNDDDNVSYPEVVAEIKGNVLPKLDAVFNEIWPQDHIWQDAIDRLTKYEMEEDFDAIKILNMSFWLTYTAILAHKKIPYAADRLFNDHIQVTLKEIITYAEPSMRYTLSSALVQVCADDNTFKIYQHLAEKCSVRTLLPSLFIALEIGAVPLEDMNLLTDSACCDVLKKMSKNYKHGGNLRPCVAGIRSIFQASELTISSKIDLANKILTSRSISEQISQWFLVQGLHLTNEMSALTPNNMALVDGNLELAFHRALAKIFNLSEKSSQYYHQTFGQQNAKTALLTYYGKMLQLPTDERDVMLNTLRNYVDAVLSVNSQDFYTMRYDTSNNAHLESIFASNPWLEKPWRNGASERYDDFVAKHNIAPIPFRIDLSDFLVKKVLKHQHLPKKYTPLFKRYHSSPTSRNAIETELIAQQRTFTDKTDTLIMATCEVQLALIKAYKCSEKNTTVQSSLLKKIKKSLTAVHDAKEFENDLSTMLKHLSKTNSKHKTLDTSHWKIVDTDNYWWLFMAGTFVEGSCQRVDGSPSLNKCLMGYVNNGDYRMVAIVDENTIIARCMFHLMSDPLKSRVVLFIEEAYPETLNSIQRQVIEKFAIQRAISLGLTLANLEGSLESTSYGAPLTRAPGGAPYLYCDATFDHAKDGELTIKDSQIVYAQAHYALTYPANINNQCNSSFNFLAQAWQSGAISQITWQKQYNGYRPVRVTLSPSINDEQKSLLCLYQHHAKGQLVTWNCAHNPAVLASEEVIVSGRARVKRLC